MDSRELTGTGSRQGRSDMIAEAEAGRGELPAALDGIGGILLMFCIIAGGMPGVGG